MRLNALNAGQSFELTSQRRKRKEAPEFKLCHSGVARMGLQDGGNMLGWKEGYKKIILKGALGLFFDAI